MAGKNEHNIHECTLNFCMSTMNIVIKYVILVVLFDAIMEAMKYVVVMDTIG